MNRKDMIFHLACDFREAIDRLYEEGAFYRNPVMQSFPRGSCGYVSDMLGEYLLRNGIATLFVYGTYEDQSHAWLVDKLGVTRRHIRYEIEDVPRDIRKLLKSYGSDINEKSHSEYYEFDISNGLIIDITGDQFHDKRKYGFYDESVYVGKPDDFHLLFETRCSQDAGLYNDPQQLIDYKMIVDNIEIYE